jgi:hypothetical protein
MTFAAGFGFFPSIFGLQFQTIHTGRPRPAGGGALHSRPLTPEEQSQQQLERAMLAIGGIILFCLLFM